jgi:hypothetical protein
MAIILSLSLINKQNFILFGLFILGVPAGCAVGRVLAGSLIGRPRCGPLRGLPAPSRSYSSTLCTIFSVFECRTLDFFQGIKLKYRILFLSLSVITIFVVLLARFSSV